MKRILRPLIVLALTVLFLALFLRNSDPAKVIQVLASTQPLLLTLALAANVGALLFRSLRWRIILDPENPPPLSATFFATAVGYMVSMILPVRAADVARPALLARKTPIRFATALGTMVTERILDLSAMLTLFLLFILIEGPRIFSDPAAGRSALTLRTAGIVCGVLLSILLAFLVVVYFAGQKIRRVHSAIGRIVPVRFRESWMRFFDSFAESLELVHHRGALAKVGIFTAGIWVSLTGQLFLVLLALRHPLPYSATFLITGMTILGLIVPTPAGVGGYHKAAQIALTTFYAFDVDSSVAVAFVFHIVGVGPVIVTGLILFLREGLSWRSMSELAKDETGAVVSTSRGEE